MTSDRLKTLRPLDDLPCYFCSREDEGRPKYRAKYFAWFKNSGNVYATICDNHRRLFGEAIVAIKPIKPIRTDNVG